MKGGRRRKHVPKAFDPDQVRDLRQRLQDGATYKALMRETGRCRDVIRRAVYGLDTYGGIQSNDQENNQTR